MAELLRRLSRGLAQLPGRILAAAGWPTAAGVGVTNTGGVDELEAKRRREREAWRQGVDEDDQRSPT